MGRVGAALLAALAAAAVAGCEPSQKAREREVMPLDVPSDAEREAAEKLAQAKALLAAGGEKEAEPLLRRVLELSPKNVAALSALSDLLLQRRHFEEAASMLRRLVEGAPEDFGARQRLFEALLARHDFAAAETVARDWKKATSDSSSDACYALGRSLRMQHKLDAAAEVLERAKSLKAARADVRSELGLVLLEQGKLARAEAAQRDAVQRQPKYGEAWVRLADILLRGASPRVPEAVAALRRALDGELARPGAVHVQLYRLLCLLAKSDASKTGDAEGQWRVLLAAAGRDMLPWDGLGAPPAAVPNPAKTERALRDAVIAHPDDAKARLALALFLHRRGDVAGAADEYAEAMLGLPGDSRLRSALGAALLVRGDASTAESQLAQAVRLDSNDQTSWRNLGWSQLLLGRDADAVASFDRALKLFDGDHLARRARGLARMHQGDLDGGLAEVTASGWMGR